MSFDRDGFYRDVGHRIQLQRKRARMTQEEVAKELSMPRATFANVERGRQRVPVDVIWRLAVLFDVAIHVILPEPVREAKTPPSIPSELFSGTSAFKMLAGG